MEAPATPSAAHLACAKLILTVGQHSVAGRKPDNEDAIGIRVPDGVLLATKGAAAVIADGISAAEAGKEASQTAVTSFLSDYFSTPETWTAKKSGGQVLTSLNRWLYNRGRSYADSNRGYLTTFSALVLKSRQAHIFHVGDSRIYRYREGTLEQLTRDHSMPVAENQTYLTRALGMDVTLDVDYRNSAVEEGDLFLLSTDGIHDTLGPERMGRLLAAAGQGDLQALCQQVAEQALAAGSGDNLSCQLLRVDALPQAEINDVVNQLTELRFPPLLEPGLVLDGYRVIRELHASNRSQVYHVEDVETGAHYCMKTPSSNFEDDPAYIERFVMESWIGSRIHSPYVVRVIEPPRKKSCLYYLTEYVSGITLSRWMLENPRPQVEEAVYLIEQIAKGVRAFHRRETLHQDLKPDNILIDRQGHVKLVDFGACHVGGISEIATPLERDVALGTATYSAPEYSLGNRASYQSDQFALAVISYEMLTGKLPFEGKLEKCKSQRDYLATRYIESYRYNPHIPHWVDGALRKGLRLEPERRHGDVMEFAHELKHPNPRYLEYDRRPLLQRDPLLVWKTLCGILLLSQLATLYFLFN